MIIFTLKIELEHNISYNDFYLGETVVRDFGP